ncbi:MAG TPA: TadE/TadG family type IV pilus assembly protein [Magnetovibrio sp.]
MNLFTRRQRPGFACKRFARSETGSIALMFALMLPVLFGIIGLGMEVGVWFKERRQLQTIADAAAVSAAIENAYGASSAEILAAATQEATLNGFDATTDTITYIGTPTSGAYIGDTAYIEVKINRQLETILSQVFYSLSPSTIARAVASTTGDQEACVLALSTTAMNSVYVNGAGSTVSMEGCSLVANSNDSTKAINVQNGTLESECLSAVGGISGEANITTNCSAPVSGGAAVTDPFAAVDVPTYTGCDQDPHGAGAYTPADGETLTEGVYCGGLSFSSDNTVHMAPGTYVINKGDFTVNGGAIITGDNVTIILTSSTGTGYGTITFNGNANVDLSAPTTADTTGAIQGDYIGMLFYQDRNGGSSSSLDAKLTGGSSTELAGAVYLPNNSITFNGGNATDSNGCLMIVAQTVSFNGSADIDNKCDMFGGNPITYGAAPGLVE